MAWKILSIVTALCLGTACFFAYTNQQDLLQERDMLARAEANLKDTQARKKEADEALTGKQTQLAEAEKERDAIKEQVVKLAAEAQEKEAALAVLKGNLEQVTKQVEALDVKIKEAGDIEKLIAQIEALKKDQLSAEGAVANQTQRLAQVSEQLGGLNQAITKFRDAEARARKGVVDPDFTARIAQAFPDWGFVILNKGNSGGVFANADLEIKRGKDVVAKLKVRNVEQLSSIADIVPGSFSEGGFIQTGDNVVAAAQQSAAQPTKDTAPDVPPAQPPTDGGMGTPAPPAPGMGTDPFGAPATPAPAPAMGSDPFGAPATPAPAPAGGAPMGSDPFGAPAAPAGGAPPASGTPANPSTADPFAPAPGAAN